MDWYCSFIVTTVALPVSGFRYEQSGWSLNQNTRFTTSSGNFHRTESVRWKLHKPNFNRFDWSTRVTDRQTDGHSKLPNDTISVCSLRLLTWFAVDLFTIGAFTHALPLLSHSYLCVSYTIAYSLFTARCTLVQSAVLRSHVVCLSVCL